MSISVYIPTDRDGVKNLPTIIDAYKSGTVKPDQIVISASGINTTDNLDILRSIKHEDVVLYVGKSNITMAENMNNAYRFTKNDIIVYHDVNKYPSCRRLESIQKLFKQNNIVSLHHSYYYQDIFEDRDLFEDIVVTDELYNRYFPFKRREGCWRYSRTYGQEFSINVDMPSISVKREFLKNILWKEPYQYELYMGNGVGLYYEFAMDILYTYNRSMLINLPLTVVK